MRGLNNFGIAIEATRKFRAALEIHPQPTRHALRVVFLLQQIRVVEKIRRRPRIPQHRHAAAEEQAVAPDLRIRNRKQTARARSQPRFNRVTAIAVFMLPAQRSFRSHDHATEFPIIRDAQAERRPDRLDVLPRIAKRRKPVRRSG